jgi:heme/copper-type cytochrome/quinol oxidase subunit 2
VLLIIASIISIFTIFGITATILFIIAAVSSLSKKTESPVPPKPKQNGLQNAALTLCIIGAVIAVSISLIAVIFGAYEIIPNDHVIKSPSSEINDMYMTQFIRSIIALAGGVLGIFSALSIRKKMRKAGIMMIIAAAFCVGTCWYIPTALFTISAVFVFIYANKQQTQPDENNKQPGDELIQ